MAAESALSLLRAADPAAQLEPLREQQRASLRDAAMTLGRARQSRYATPRRRALVRIAIAVAAVALLTTGIAWAAGALSPLGLFEANPESDGSAPGSVWDQKVVAGSVEEVGSVEVPRVGVVAFWYGRTSQGGWCAGLRLEGGDWLGTGKAPLDGGGTVPGCFPTREMINGASSTPVLVLNGFDYAESDADARSVGGSFWRIRYGRVTAPAATRVTDLVSGETTPVIHGDLFLLALRDPDPTKNTGLHLVAYDSDGKVVADDCPNCGGR
jgi:hypothetical protein